MIGDDEEVRFPVGFMEQVADAHTKEEVLSVTAVWMRDMLDCERSSIAIFEGSHALKLYAIDGNAAIETGALLPLDGTMVGHVVRSQEVLSEPDLPNSEWLDCQKLADAGLKSCCDAPIISGEKCFGSLNVASIKPDYFKEKAERQLLGVARWMGSRLNILQQIDTLSHLSASCSLTGLANRASRDRYLAAKLADEDFGDPVYLSIDLGSFRAVNDRFGHLAGDAVLAEVARRLRNFFGSEVLAARVGNKEFSVLLEHQKLNMPLHELGEILVSQLSAPVHHAGEWVSVSVSLGMVHALRESCSVKQVLQDADRALSEAKRQGDTKMVLLEPSRLDHSELPTGEQIMSALDSGRISAWLQPLMSGNGKHVVGFEALSRWRMPEGEIIGPAQFLEPIRRLGLVREHCLALIRSLDEFISILPDDLDQPIALALNVAQEELNDEVVVKWLCEWVIGLPQHKITPVLEVNENISFESAADIETQAIIRLDAAGFRISLDDFGAGRGSMGRLLSIPIHQVKIDRCFVREIGNDSRGEAIIQSLIKLARDLHVSVVGEGVENETQLRYLDEAGCDYLQGFMFAPAMPAGSALNYLLQNLDKKRDKAI